MSVAQKTKRGRGGIPESDRFEMLRR